ncbi:MAG: hypothetical protein R2734_08815 [Nocardioides sp.]
MLSRPLPRPGPHRAIVVSPDLGNAKTATQFARLLGLPVAAGSKQRLADDQVVIDSIVGDVHGQRAIVLDDEIVTGGSIVRRWSCSTAWPTRRVSAAIACTHGLFVGKAVDRLRQHPMISEVVDRHGAAPARLARAPGAVRRGPVRRDDRPRARRQVGEQPVRRGRPGAGTAATKLFG